MIQIALPLLFALSLSAPGGPSAQPAETFTAECKLTNAAYSGSCTVTETAPKSDSPQTVCGRVLACLNDSRCTKTYCNSTTVRGGWKLDESKDTSAPKK